MAISIEELAAPTLLAIGDSLTAGSLVPGQTWYFRVVAVKGTGSSDQYLDSAWMTEASWTVGVDKSAIDISWNAVAGAARYYVLATLTSGAYNDANACIVAGYNLSATSFTWTGTWPSGSYYKFWYRPSGVPNIVVEGGSAGTPLTFDDIYNADVAAGWDRVDRQRVKGSGTEPYVEYNAGAPRPHLKNSYVVDASLTFGQAANCYFKQNNADILVLGALRFDNTYTKLFQLGTRTGSEMGKEGCELHVRGTCDVTFKGTCNIYGSSLISESAEYNRWVRTMATAYYAHTWKAMGLATDASAVFNMITSQVYGMWKSFIRAESGLDLHNLVIGIYDGIAPRNASMSDTKIAQADQTAMLIALLAAPAQTATFTRCRSLYGCGADMRWEMARAVGADATFIDCTFESKGQTNNDPYGSYWRGWSTAYIYGGALIFKHEFDPIFVDTEGNLLVGATVLLTDKDGATIINDTTGADGTLTGGAVNVTRRIITCNPGFTGYQTSKYLSWMIAQGYYLENVRNPHTLTVSKDGETYLEATFNIEARMNSYIIVDMAVYADIVSVSITDGDANHLQVGHTYTLEVVVSLSASADKARDYRVVIVCDTEAGLAGSPSAWQTIMPGGSQTFVFTITPTVAGEAHRFCAHLEEQTTDDIVSDDATLEVHVDTTPSEPAQIKLVEFTSEPRESSMVTPSSGAMILQGTADRTFTVTGSAIIENSSPASVEFVV